VARWARFGVDNYSTHADALMIVDEQASIVRRWSWREKKPVEVEAAPPSV
jgi:hypothetical protein